MSKIVSVRSTALNNYVELVQALGADPYPLMRAAGISPTCLSTPDAWLPAQDVDELFEHTARETQRADFGLRLAEARRTSNLSPVGLAAREEPDVRAAIGVVLRYMILHDGAIRTRLSEAHGIAILSVEPAPGVTLGRQSIELTVAAVAQIIDGLLPDDWHPLCTCFIHAAPPDLGHHRDVLGPDVSFGRDFNGIVLYSSDLDSANITSHPPRRPYSRQSLDLTPSAETSLPGRVADIVEALLPGGRCSAVRVARSLGMDQRTLNRHLAQSGKTYSSILNSVRVDLAKRYITRGDLRLTDVATELGFSELSAFSRWFRRQFGVNPMKWSAHQHIPS